MIDIIIKLEYEALYQMGSQLNKQMYIFEQCISDIQFLITTLPTIWQGCAADAYVEQFNQLKPSFLMTSRLICEIKAQLLDIVEVVKVVDSDMAKRLHF